MYDVQFIKQAVKDASKVKQAGLKPKTDEIIDTVEKDPFDPSHSFEKLKGDLKGAYSRRINRQHRFVYEVLPNIEGKKDANGELYEGIVKVLSMWTHYE